MTKAKPKAVVMVMPYRAEVALFDGYKDMERHFEDIACVKIHDFSAAYGAACRYFDADGTPWRGLYLKDSANFSTLVHECSHMVDFIFADFQIPTGKKNTEVRAYTLAELVGDVAEVFGFEMERK